MILSGISFGFVTAFAAGLMAWSIRSALRRVADFVSDFAEMCREEV
jgi:hypothetical protein